MKQATYCPNHPDTPTNLRCGRCEKLVCPQCMVHTPVGVRCRECGQGTPIPTYQVSASYLTRAVLASVVTGVVGGLLIPLLVAPGLNIIYLLGMAGYGYLMAEVVGLASNRKRGRTLQLVAGGGVLLAVVIIATISATVLGYVNLFGLLGGGLGVYVAYIRLR